MVLGKALTLAIPLVSYLAYHAANKAPFLSIQCTLLNVGCPSYIPIHGFVHEEYKEVYDLFVDNFKQGRDVGAAISAYVDGKQILSLQGGWADVENKIEYTNETLQMVFSSTKALSSIIIAQLVDQGLLSYDGRIAIYWPEFAQGNKENVTLMDLMRHTSGVACLDHPLSYENVTDPKVFSDILAKQPHNFDGEPIHAYQAITQGWYQNEIIRRVDPQQRTIDDFAREFKQKWGSEWYLKPDATEGVDLNRISPFYEKSTYQQFLPLIISLIDPRKDSSFARGLFDKNSVVYRSIINPNIDQQRGIMNNGRSKYRALEGPSYSGHTNADSIAKIAAMMANRGKAIVPGEPDIFQNDSTFDDILKFVANETDAVFPQVPLINLKGGLMLFPNNALFKIDDDDADFIGGVGAGGSLFIWNTKHKVAFAFVMNGYTGIGKPDERNIPIIKSIVETVIKQKKNAA